MKSIARLVHGSSLLVACALPVSSFAQLEFPPGLEATFRIVGGSAVRGGTVTLPLTVLASSESPEYGFEGFSFSVDFDEEVLEFIGFERRFSKPDGKEWCFAALVTNNLNESPGNGGVDEGYLVGGVLFCSCSQENPNSCGYPNLDMLPPLDTENEMLGLQFRVKPDAPLGSTEVRFLDGARTHPWLEPPLSPPISNVATLGGHSADLTVYGTPTVINAFLGIVDELSMFIRGDANGDFNIDLSDAVWTLGYLFRGERTPPCLDAADANDDGKLDISDPVVTLQVLFHGAGSLPPPSAAAPGQDPTDDDSLQCFG